MESFDEDGETMLEEEEEIEEEVEEDENFVHE